MCTKERTNSYFLYFLFGICTENLTAVKGCDSCCQLPQDCQAVRDLGHLNSGVYHIYPGGVYSGFEVYCDMETDGGGWLVFQRRMDSTVSFDRGWKRYLKGFGNLTGEHWLGTYKLHLITSQGAYELRIELTDWEGESRYAKYDAFKVGAPLENYVLTAVGYEGDAGNGLFRHHGMQFSTRNIDNDLWADSCANNSSGGWWYSGELNNCLTANLNGKYFQDGDTGGTETGIMWTIWKGENYSLKYAEMKIRRLQDLNTDDIQY